MAKEPKPEHKPIPFKDALQRILGAKPQPEPVKVKKPRRQKSKS
jgi:hypothetical protein